MARMLENRDRRRDFERCLEDRDLSLAYQPIVDARKRSVVAYEALLRPGSPVFPGPVDLLEYAERVGHLSRLGEAVTDRILEGLQRIEAPALLFVNLHPGELGDCTCLAKRLSRSLPWADRLVFEITERAYLLEIRGWLRSIQLIAEMGYALALDDMGSGYNSLAMLAQLEPQYIKVDMSIVRGVDRDERKSRLIQLLCRFAETTDSTVIAEGVEQEDEAEALIRCGVGLLQGYLFGHPTVSAPAELKEARPSDRARQNRRR